MFSRVHCTLLPQAFLFGAAALLMAASMPGQSAAPVWLPSWGAAQTAPYGNETVSADAFEHATLRQVVHLSVGGTRLQLRLSNVFGEEALRLRSVHVAQRAPGEIPGAVAIATDHTVTFDGKPAVTIPAGAEFRSDPVSLSVAPLSDVVVSIEVDHAPRTPTVHAGARATSFLSIGDHAGEARLPSPQTFARWYFLSGIDVAGDRRNTRALLAFGDSITDGHGATTDGNDRWPDVLAARLNTGAGAKHMGVVNVGIGGNRILEDGIGPGALARFSRDVLAREGTQTVLILEGINDLGNFSRSGDHPPAAHAALVGDLESALRQMALQAHEHGLRVVGATLTPFLGSEFYHPGPASEADRQSLNTWIRTSGAFDAVVDFDAVVRDPAHPERLLPSADSGDHLHPGPAGYRRMAQAIPIGLLTR